MTETIIKLNSSVRKLGDRFNCTLKSLLLLFLAGLLAGFSFQTRAQAPAITLTNIDISVCQHTADALLYYTTTNDPNQYSITWSGGGFVTVLQWTALPASPITIVIPVAAEPGLYTGTILVKNSATGLVSSPKTFTVNIDPLIIPAFDPIGALCLNSVAPSLPNMSNNAIPGTWSPPTINTSVAGTATHVFTPDSGECAMALSLAVTVAEPPAASILYPGSTFCTSQGPVKVELTGTTGGQFSAMPQGLSLDPVKGWIDTQTSDPGNYTVTYTITDHPCGMITASTNVTIVAQPVADFYYPGNPFCLSSGLAYVNLTGTPGGIFSSSPGLSIDSITGTIYPSKSPIGQYIVTYTMPAFGKCVESTATTTVIIIEFLTAKIVYPDDTLSISDPPLYAIMTGMEGGIFDAQPAGLTIDSQTGTITPATSSIGSYTVTYSLSPDNGCGAVMSSTSITIVGASSDQQIIAEEKIRVYPNPNNGTFTFEYQSGESGTLNLSVIDLTGRVILNHVFESSSAEISERIKLPDQSKGIFWIRLITGSKVDYRKMVVD